MTPREPLLKDAFPEFYAEVAAALESEGVREFLSQLPELRVVSRCGCGASECATFDVLPARELNIVERNIIGDRGGVDILSPPIDGLLGMSVDNFGRIRTFELWNRPDVSEGLKALGISRSRA